MNIFLHHPLLGNIPHGFFTRLGGVSEGIFGSLNVGVTSTDHQEKVYRNFHIIQKIMHADFFCTPRQTHSNGIVTLTKPWDMQSSPYGDGIVTKQKGVLIGVVTADCIPILLSDDKAQVIGAVHVGWRGYKSGVLLNALCAMENLGAKRESIIGILGPAIQRENYEVGEDFYKTFCASIPESVEYFYCHKEKYFFDLYACVKNSLKTLSLKDVGSMDMDTYSDSERFYSCRRANHNGHEEYGRQASVILLR